jgi:hypothetical protein
MLSYLHHKPYLHFETLLLDEKIEQWLQKWINWISDHMIWGNKWKQVFAFVFCLEYMVTQERIERLEKWFNNKVIEISDLIKYQQTKFKRKPNPIELRKQNQNSNQTIPNITSGWITSNRNTHVQQPSVAMCMVLINFHNIPTDFISSQAAGGYVTNILREVCQYVKT